MGMEPEILVPGSVSKVNLSKLGVIFMIVREVRNDIYVGLFMSKIIKNGLSSLMTHWHLITGSGTIEMQTGWQTLVVLLMRG